MTSKETSIPTLLIAEESETGEEIWEEIPDQWEHRKLVIGSPRPTHDFWNKTMTEQKDTLMGTKLTSLINSRRFYALVAGILTVIFQDGLGLTDQTTMEVVGLLMAWIVGDSINKT